MTEAVARLIELRPDGSERVHELDVGAHVLGRDPSADVTLEHRDVSRRHAELTVTAEGLSIRDLGSKNGLAIDGRRARSGRLGDGARLGIGELALRVEFLGTHVDRLLAEHGEVTVRRPRAIEVPIAEVAAAAGGGPSVVVPVLATLAFTALLVVLLVFG